VDAPISTSQIGCSRLRTRAQAFGASAGQQPCGFNEIIVSTGIRLRGACRGRTRVEAISHTLASTDDNRQGEQHYARYSRHRWGPARQSYLVSSTSPHDRFKQGTASLQ